MGSSSHPCCSFLVRLSTPPESRRCPLGKNTAWAQRCSAGIGFGDGRVQGPSISTLPRCLPVCSRTWCRTVSLVSVWLLDVARVVFVQGRVQRLSHNRIGALSGQESSAHAGRACIRGFSPQPLAPPLWVAPKAEARPSSHGEAITRAGATGSSQSDCTSISIST